MYHMEKLVIPIADICGTAEVAEVLGVSKQRIASLRKMPTFPDPIVVLASTPLWDKMEIINFLRSWQPWKVLAMEGDSDE